MTWHVFNNYHAHTYLWWDEFAKCSLSDLSKPRMAKIRLTGFDFIEGCMTIGHPDQKLYDDALAIVLAILLPFDIVLSNPDTTPLPLGAYGRAIVSCEIAAAMIGPLPSGLHPTLANVVESQLAILKHVFTLMSGHIS